MIAGKDKRFPGLSMFPCFWQQVCKKKNDFYENVIIHSKTRVGVTMKNSSLVDTLSRNNRSKRKATGIKRTLWPMTNYVCKMMGKPIENWEISSAVNQRLILKSSPDSQKNDIYIRHVLSFLFSRLWIIILYIVSLYCFILLLDFKLHGTINNMIF